MQETDPTRNKSKIPVGRRDFLKLTTIGAGVGTATVGSIAITGSAQAARGITVRAKGGKINDFLLNSNTKFQIGWNNVSRRSNIYLFIQGKIQGEDNEAIMGNDRITADGTGSRLVSVTDFTDSEYFGVVAQHDLIDADDISVDLDNHVPGDNYTKTTSFDLNLYGFHSASTAADEIDVRDVYRGRRRGNGNAGNQNNGNGNAGNQNNSNDNAEDNNFGDDVNNNRILGTVDPNADALIDTAAVTRSITVEAILGAGIHFGKEFGVTNSHLPEGRY